MGVPTRIHSPLEIFPEEVWNMILMRFDDYEDVSSVLDSFPAPTDLPWDFNCSWLIDEVMPLLFPKYLDATDIQTCLSVSEKWKSAITTTINNHQDYRPYNCLEENALPETHFNYFPLPLIETYIDPRLESTEDTHGKNLRRPPLVGGAVLFTIYAPKYLSLIRADNIACGIGPILPFLTTHGSKIRHISYDIIGSFCSRKEYLERVLKPLLHSLLHLPCLKSFELTLSFQLTDKDLAGRNDNFKKIKIPAKLESLMLPSIPWSDPLFTKNIQRAFIETFATHPEIKMLSVHILNLTSNYKSIFPNLTELHLAADNTFFKDDVSHAFQHVKFPCLRKLRVTCGRLKIRKLLEALQSLQIESLELFITGWIQFSEANDFMTIFSVTSLQLTVLPATTLRFLKCFPNLQNLSVFLSSCANWGNGRYRPSEREMEPVSMALRRYKVEDRTDPENFRCVWRELPSLKMLWVHKMQGQNQVSRQYVVELKDKVFSSLGDNPLATDMQIGNILL